MTTKATTRICLTMLALGVIAVDFLANYTNTDSGGWDATATVVLIFVALAWWAS